MIQNQENPAEHMPIATVEHSIVGVFPTNEGVEKAFQVLEKRGYRKDEINIVMSDKTYSDLFQPPIEQMLIEGRRGAAIGGVLGATIGALATLGTSILIPGIGLVSGPLFGALAGAGTFAIGGGTYAAALGLDTTEQELPNNHDNHIKKGHILISVHPHSFEDADYIVEQWKNIPSMEEVIRQK
jgi:hypothetical protein